jgi:hypothetical protein
MDILLLLGISEALLELITVNVDVNGTQENGIETICRKLYVCDFKSTL